MQVPRRSRRLQGLQPEPYSFSEKSQEKDSQPIWSCFVFSVAIATLPVFFTLLK